MAKRVKAGDVFRIPVANGLGYFQFTHDNKLMGKLIRVLPGVHEAPPDLWKLVEGEEQFITFFPLAQALKEEIVVFCRSEPIPDSSVRFPVFRNGIRDPSTSKFGAWWFWDGVREWRVGELTFEQRKLPLMEIINDTLLKERIQTRWRPEDVW